MKLRKLHDFDFTIFQISLNLSVVKYDHFKFANFNCREKFHVKTVQKYLAILGKEKRLILEEDFLLMPQIFYLNG